MSIHGSPVIHFPATEIADLKAQLASGRTISVPREGHEQGKHRAGDILMSSLGMLRVMNVKQVAPHEMTAHSGAVKAHVSGERGDVLELKKLGNAPMRHTTPVAIWNFHSAQSKTATPALDILQAKAAASTTPVTPAATAPASSTTGRMAAIRNEQAAIEAKTNDIVKGHQDRMAKITKQADAMTDTPALDILAEQAKQAGLANFGRNALMAGALGSAGIAGGMGGHQLVSAHQSPVAVVPSAMPGRSDVTVGGRPSDYRGYQHGAAHEIAGNMQDMQGIHRALGGLAGGGAAGGAAALALLAARRRPQLGAGPVA